MAQSKTADRLKQGRHTLRVFLDAAQAFEDDQVQAQMKKAEAQRIAGDNRLRVALSHVLLKDNLYRRFAGAQVIDVRKMKQLEQVERRASKLVDTETRRMERALMPPAGRIKAPGAG